MKSLFTNSSFSEFNILFALSASNLFLRIFFVGLLFEQVGLSFINLNVRSSFCSIFFVDSEGEKYNTSGQ